MNKARLWEILAHPAVISFIIWGIILVLKPFEFSEYKVSHLNDEYGMTNTYIYFHDLNSDGNSEKVSMDLNDQERTKIIFYDGNKVMDEYDLKYQPLDYTDMFFADYNNDGNYEVYVFTANQDSIFLNIIDAIILKKTFVADRFVDFRRKGPFSNNYPFIAFPGPIVKPGQPVNDILFYISTGFSLQPRNVYRFNVENDHLVKSPESGAIITGCIITDLNDDSIPEILLSTNAAGNMDENFPYSDHYTWLMVLDYNLKFLFPPVKLDINSSRARTLPLTINKRTYIIALRDYMGNKNTASVFSLFNPEGKMISSKPVGEYENTYSGIFANKEDCSTFYFLKNRSGDIVLMDSSYKTIRTMSIPPVKDSQYVFGIDADGDGKQEYVFQGADANSIVIVQDDFSHPVTWNFTQEDYESPSITKVLKKGTKLQLYLQFSHYGSYIRFEKNRLYFLKYPVYLGLYFCLLLFVTLIAQLQKYRLNIKLETERKIARLQMRAIRNQADPHFTLNVLNAIGSLYATEPDRQKADYLFAKYARLIRQTVVSSDQITVTLADEIDFVKNYLDLERFRSDNSFDYSIDMASGVNPELKIPRMLIHTFVENAIKYGIKSKTEGGIIKINIEQKNNNYIVIIEDNGNGISSSVKPGESTGKGLKILNEMIELYRNLERKNLAYSYQNNYDYQGNITGLRAIIKIPLKKSSSGY